MKFSNCKEKEGTFGYVPETENTTGLPFHEREAHNHVLKVITSMLQLRDWVGIVCRM